MRTTLLISSAYGWFVGLLVLMVVMAVLFVLIAMFALKPVKFDQQQGGSDLAQKLLEKREAELTMQLLSSKEDKAVYEETESKLREVSSAKRIVDELIAEELGVTVVKQHYGVDDDLTDAEKQSLDNNEKQTLEQTFSETPAQDDSGIKKSFTAQLMQASDNIKVWYFELKNCILCYEKTKEIMHWHNEKFYIGRNNVATLTMRGKTLSLYLALDPEEYSDRFHVRLSQSEVYRKVTPCLFRIKSDKSVKQAKELIALLMADYDVMYVRTNHSIYALPYEDDDALVAKGLAKKQ